jgi:hypothetical protein
MIDINLILSANVTHKYINTSRGTARSTLLDSKVQIKIKKNEMIFKIFYIEFDSLNGNVQRTELIRVHLHTKTEIPKSFFFYQIASFKRQNDLDHNL